MTGYDEVRICLIKLLKIILLVVRDLKFPETVRSISLTMPPYFAVEPLIPWGIKGEWNIFYFHNLNNICMKYFD